MNRETHIKMASDDMFFSFIMVAIGLYASTLNWTESDWWGLLGTIFLTIFGLLWLGASIYHLTHKDEVFGEACEHGKGLDDFCEPCGRTHSG